MPDMSPIHTLESCNLVFSGPSLALLHNLLIVVRPQLRFRRKEADRVSSNRAFEHFSLKSCNDLDSIPDNQALSLQPASSTTKLALSLTNCMR